MPRRRGQIAAALPLPAPTPTGPPQEDSCHPPELSNRRLEEKKKQKNNTSNLLTKLGENPQTPESSESETRKGKGLPAPP